MFQKPKISAKLEISNSFKQYFSYENFHKCVEYNKFFFY